MVMIEAKVMDATHIELSEPIGVDQGKRIFVAVADSTSPDSERWQWIRAGEGGLLTAYGDAEPEYTPAMVSERNPAYVT